MAGAERTIQSDGLEFQTQAFGDHADPAVLMIMGAIASMLWWPDALCAALAETGRYVIRYDNRDTGRSTTYAPGPPLYTVDDMAGDAMAILDGYGIGQAHLAGMSLGGIIAQLAALKFPQRVLSLTLIGTSAFDESDPDLPPIEPALLEHFSKIETLDWADRAAVTAFHVETFRICAGPNANFDAARARDLAEREYDRALNPSSALNHSMLAGGEAWAGRISEIACPALVIHGRHDPINSLAHGKKLAAALPTARLVELDAGHELNERDWDLIVDEIKQLTA